MKSFQSLNPIKKQSLYVLVCLASIFTLGLVMVFDTSSAEIIDLSLKRNMHQAPLRQVVYALIGVCSAFLVRRLGYHKLLKMSPSILVFFTFLLALTFVPGIGRIRNGAYRWIGIGGYTIQPSEFVKYILTFYYVDFFLSKKARSLDFKDFLVLISTSLIPIFLILIEPDHGTTAICGLMILLLLFLAQVPFKFWAWPVLFLCFVGALGASQVPYVKARIKVYLHPELDLRGKGHQPRQAKIAVGSGRLWGRGLGKSMQKLSYLPEAKNDYIAAIYAEEFGFMGVLLLICLYMCFAYFGFSIAYQAQDQAGFYLATCITFLVFVQAFLNLGVVSALLPSTGLNLPFFSQGGTSLMANIVAVGVVLDIAECSKYSKMNHLKGKSSQGVF